MIQTWVIYAMSAGLLSSLFNFLTRFALTKDKDSSASGWFSEVVRVLIVLVFIPWDGALSLSTHTLFIFIALGVIEFFSVFIFMKMHAFTHLSISTIVARTRLVWIPLIAFLVLGERLSVLEYGGIIVLFVGLSTVVSPKRLFVDKGLIYTSISSFIVAILSIVMKMASGSMSSSWILIAMALPTILFYPLLLKKKRIINGFKHQIPAKIAAAGANVFSMYLYIYALKIGEVSKVTAIYQGMMIVSILAGVIFLRERQDVGKKLVGAVITLAGVYMLTVF